MRSHPFKHRRPRPKHDEMASYGAMLMTKHGDTTGRPASEFVDIEAALARATTRADAAAAWASFAEHHAARLADDCRRAAACMGEADLDSLVEVLEPYAAAEAAAAALAMQSRLPGS